MAKLYWRVKKNGKWTWLSAGKLLEFHLDDYDVTVILDKSGYVPEDQE